MAQKILIRRGPIANLAGAASSQGELLLATGVIGDLTGPFLTMTGTSGTGTSTIIGKIYEGAATPSITTNSPLTGLPYYNTTDNALIRLNHAGNQTLDLTGNLEGNAVSSMTISQLVGNVAIVGDGALEDGDLSVAGLLSVTGDISGSNLNLTGNATIDGNIVLGGNINIGDADTDTITLGGEITSNIIPDVDSTYDLGSTSKRWANIYADALTGDTIALSSNANIGGTLGATGDVTFGNALTVSGNTNLQGTLGVVGAVDFDSTLNVDGNTELQGTLLAVGAASFSNTVSVSNNATIGGTLGVTGATTLSSTLGVTGAATLSSTLSVTGASTLSGTVTLGSVVNEGVAATKILTLDTNGNVDFRTPSQVLSDIGAASGTVNLQAVTDNGATSTNDITVAGITAGNVTVGVSSDNTITTTSGNLTIDSAGGTVTVDDDLTISGNLTVSGTTTTVDSTTVQIGDNIIELNAAGTAADGGIVVQDVVGAGTASGSLLWNATNDYWYAGTQGNTHYRVSTYEAASPTTNALPKINSDKRLVASAISDDGTAVTIIRNTTIAGIIDSSHNSTTSFSYITNSNGLAYTTPAATGDILQFNGTTMVASNVIDGGTF